MGKPLEHALGDLVPQVHRNLLQEGVPLLFGKNVLLSGVGERPSYLRSRFL